MTDIFDTAFQNLLIWEGGYGNAAHDDGGPTNLGVVQAEYDAYRKRKGELHQSVKYITKAEAEDIYRNEYWDATLCGQLNPGVANCVFDSDVNSGDREGVKWLQEAINQVVGKPYVTVDGKPGPATVAAANQCPPDKLIDAILNIRLAFMKVCRNAEGELLWPHFGRGWNDRIIGVRKQSHALAETSIPPVSSTSAKLSPSTQTPVPTSNPAPTPTMEPVMATAATTVPESATLTPATSVTAGLNLSTSQVVNAMIGNLMSAVVTVGAPVLAAFSGTTTAHYVAGALFGLSGLGALITNTWGFLNHNSAVSSNTVSTVNQLSAIAGQVATVLNTPAPATVPSANPSPAAA